MRLGELLVILTANTGGNTPGPGVVETGGQLVNTVVIFIECFLMTVTVQDNLCRTLFILPFTTITVQDLELYLGIGRSSR